MVRYNEAYKTDQIHENDNEQVPVSEQIIIVVASLFLIALGFGLGIAFASL